MPKRSSPERFTDADDNDTKTDDRSGCKLRKDDQRSAANTRERTRMRVLSKAFCKLKTTLPWVPMDTKLSKLDTLRLASSYIGHLNRMLLSEDGESCGPLTFCPESLSWPLLFDSRAMDSVIRKGQSSPDSGDGQSS